MLEAGVLQMCTSAVLYHVVPGASPAGDRSGRRAMPACDLSYELAVHSVATPERVAGFATAAGADLDSMVAFAVLDTWIELQLVEQGPQSRSQSHI